MVLIKMYKNKYYNIKTRASDGTVLDSVREARRYEELLILQRAGKITDLQRQVRYELIPAQYETYERFSKSGERLKDGKRLLERGVDYVADFVYKDVESGNIIVEDAKGFKTKEYTIKRKLLLSVHNIRIKEV